MNNHQGVIALVFFGCLWSLSAEPTQGLTPDQAVQQALNANLGLAAEDSRLAQKADERAFSFNRLYPTVSTSATLLRLNQVNLGQWEQMWPLINNGAVPQFSTITDGLTEDNHWALSLGVKVQLALSPGVFQGAF